MGNGQGTNFFIKNTKRQEKIRLSDWNANPEKYDHEIQEWQDRRGVSNGYGIVKHRIVYHNCDSCKGSGCPECNNNGYIKKELIKPEGE